MAAVAAARRRHERPGPMSGTERPAAPATVRLLTWNLHAGIGPDGRYDLDRLVTLVRHPDPDIVAPQELDSRGRGDTSPFLTLAPLLTRKNYGRGKRVAVRGTRAGH